MKFKIISMLLTLAMLSIMPLIYMGKINPAEWLSGDIIDTGKIGKQVSKVTSKVTSIGKGADVTVYKWKDSHGVTQFGGKPPTGATNIEIVSVNQNKNIIDATRIPPKEEKAAQAIETPVSSPYSIKGMKKVMDDARGVGELLRKRKEEQDRQLRNL